MPPRITTCTSMGITTHPNARRPGGLFRRHPERLQEPVEGVVVDLPDALSYGFYELVVTRKPGSPAGKALEIYTGGSSYFIGATLMPRRLPLGKLHHGACRCGKRFRGRRDQSAVVERRAQESYSSQGPTNDGRTKPDISGPDGVSSNAYGGTSPEPRPPRPTCRCRGPGLVTPSGHGSRDVQDMLESWAYDIGTPGQDNLYGRGRLVLITHHLSLYKYGSGTIFISPNGTTCGSSCSSTSVVYPPGIKCHAHGNPGLRLHLCRLEWVCRLYGDRPL